MAQKTATQPKRRRLGVDADAGEAAAPRHDADPPLRGEGGGELRARQDRRLPPPLDRRGGGRRRRHRRRCAPTTTRSRPTASTGTAWPRARTPGARWPSCSAGATASARARAARCTCSTRATNFLGGHAIVGAHLPLAAGVGVRDQVPGRRPGHRVLLRRRRGARGRVPRGAEPRRAVEAARDLRLREQPLRHGHLAGARARARPRSGSSGRRYNMPCEPVDGMDVLAVREVDRRARWRARATDKTPGLIEARTYRFRGHSMRDPAGAVYRTKEEVEREKLRDPIVLFRERALDGGRAHRGRRAARSRRTSTTSSTRRSPSPTPRRSRPLE